MKLTRRRFLASTALALLTPRALSSARAERYIDTTGLRDGRFIWQPSYAQAGPLTIAVCLSQKVVHVFRSNRLLGISKIDVDPQHLLYAPGVFQVMSANGPTQTGELQAVPVFGEAGSKSPPNGDPQSLFLPPKFAKLLRATISSGSIITVSNERTAVRNLHTPAPMASEVVGDHNDTSPFRFASKAFQNALQQISAKPAVIIASIRSRRARLITGSGKAMEISLITKSDNEPTGLHIYRLMSPHLYGRAMDWFSFGLGSNNFDRHVVKDQALAALQTIRFSQSETADKLSEDLLPGATLIITDQALPDVTSATERPRLVLLSTEQASEHQQTRAQIDPPTRKPDAVTKQDPPENPIGNSLQRSATKTPQKKRARVKKSDDWWGGNSRRPGEPLIGPRSFRDP